MPARRDARAKKKNGPIGTLAETELHAALKRHYAGADGEVEVRVGGYWIDVRRGQTLIEIQTSNFSSLRPKLTKLLSEHEVVLVHPVVAQKTLIWLDARGKEERRRRSPSRGRIEDIFFQLVAFPELIGHPNLTLEVVLTREEAVRKPAEKRKRFGRGWSHVARRLLEVVGERVFAQPDDFAALLPEALPEPFTNRELASAARLSPRLSQRMTYCLRKMGVVRLEGKRGRAMLYSRAPASSAARSSLARSGARNPD